MLLHVPCVVDVFGSSRFIPSRDDGPSYESKIMTFAIHHFHSLASQAAK